MIKKAFYRALHSNLWKFLAGNFSTALAFFLAGKNYLSFNNTESFLLGIIVFISIFFARFIYFFLIEVVVYIHNTYVDSIWGKAIIDLKDAYAVMHYLRKQETIDDKIFMNSMVVFCDILKGIFDRKTKANCCVSIKVPAGQFSSIEAWELTNLCRDTAHKNRDTNEYETTKHTVIGNTPFSVIVSKLLDTKHEEKAYYLNNDIQGTKDYRNTSVGVYHDGLPYQSELVYAIIPIKSDDKHRHELLGFLCIDCNKKDAFDENRYDLPMVEGIVDGIYDIILLRNKTIKSTK